MYTVTWDDLNTEADRIAETWRGKVHSVFGIPTGGVPVALLVAQRLGVPMASEYIMGTGTLIVDDLIDTGATMSAYSGTDLTDAAFRKPWSPRKYANDARTIDDWLWFPWEHDEGDPHDAVTRILQFIGEDPTRDGLLETPKRVCKAMKEMTAGYQLDAGEILSKTFDVDHDDLIVLRGVSYWSLCEHHMLPFQGKVTVGYIPNKGARVVGLSKMARLVECFSKRLQVQERMTNQIAQAIEDHLDPLGVGVVVTGSHSCMSARGIQKDGTMVTSCLMGKMKTDAALRAEFLDLAKEANH